MPSYFNTKDLSRIISVTCKMSTIYFVILIVTRKLNIPLVLISGTNHIRINFTNVATLSELFSGNV